LEAEERFGFAINGMNSYIKMLNAKGRIEWKLYDEASSSLCGVFEPDPAKLTGMMILDT
jgi:hypothetical protein